MKLSVFAACNPYSNNFMLKAENYKALFERAKKGGMDAIEYVLEDPKDFDKEAFKKAMQETEMDVSLLDSGHLFFDKKIALVDEDEKKRELAFETLKDCLDIAKYIGTGFNIGILAGRAIKGKPTRYSEDMFVEILRDAAKYCDKIDGFFTFEPYDKNIIDFAYGTEKCIDILEKVGSDRFKLTIDIEHMYFEDKDVLTGIMQTRDYIHNVHFMNSDHNPVGHSNGNVNMDTMMKALNLINYDGYIVSNLVRAKDNPEKAKDDGMIVTSNALKEMIARNYK